MLCYNCSDLDLVAQVERYEKYEVYRILKRTSNPALEWAWAERPGCEFCQFLLSSMKGVTFPKGIEFQPNCLMSVRRKNLSQTLNGKEPPAFLVIYRRVKAPRTRYYHGRFVAFDLSHANYPKLSEGTTPPVCEMQSLVDLSVLRHRLQICTQDHDRCGYGEDLTRRRLSRFRVIDCSTREVIPAPSDAQYVALSYRWGDGDTAYKRLSGVTLPSTLPLTIDDSITTTLGLGLRYLWVDGYCIIQNDEGDFKHQIQQMDLIYRYAQITIIAAGNAGSNSGLPGISHPRHFLQAKGYFRHLPLMTFPYEHWPPILRSSWFTRGWTFQESFFSKRRLFFTADQIILECDQNAMVEGLLSDQVVPERLSKWHPDLPNWYIYQAIEEYSQRTLKFSNDILNAFEGVLRAFGARQPALKAYWGVPVLPRESGHFASFLKGLCWVQKAWNCPNYRRENFPSWSWVGWMQPVLYGSWLVSDTDIHVPQETTIHIELTDQSKMTWPDFESELFSQGEGPAVSQRFYLSAQSLQVALRKLKPTQIHGVPEVLFNSSDRASMALKSDGRFEELEPLITPTHPDARTCFAIYLFSTSASSQKSGFHKEHALLLVSRKQCCWERFGVWRPRFRSEQENASFEEWLRNSPNSQIREFCIE